MKITPALSSYLDFLRFFAAFSVLLGHMAQDGFNIAWMPLSRFSHEAVMLFFFLSGFIIYRSSIDSSRGALDYVVARSSRIYSVALPVILFCVGLSALIKWFTPELIPLIDSYREFSILDLLSCLTFTTESWTTLFENDKALTLNVPYWSLGYEVWYYIIFGCYMYVKSSWRWPLIGLSCLIAGPSVLTLFPIWILGAWYAARENSLPKLSAPYAWMTFWGTFIVVACLNGFEIDNAVKTYFHDAIPGFWRLTAAQSFLTDYLIGVAVLAHIHAFRSLSPAISFYFEKHRSLFLSLAGFSFTLYLFHRPFTQIAGAVIPAKYQTAPLASVFAITFVFLCWLISLGTEAQLPAWRRTFYHLFGKAINIRSEKFLSRMES